LIRAAHALVAARSRRGGPFPSFSAIQRPRGRARLVLWAACHRRPSSRRDDVQSRQRSMPHRTPPPTLSAPAPAAGKPLPSGPPLTRSPTHTHERSIGGPRLRAAGRRPRRGRAPAHVAGSFGGGGGRVWAVNGDSAGAELGLPRAVQGGAGGECGGRGRAGVLSRGVAWRHRLAIGL
jgi:hypothetical protein